MPPAYMAALVAAAHELKSPLSLINHSVSALVDTELKLSASEQSQYYRRIQLTTERMLRLVQQLTVSYRLGDEQQLRFAFELEPMSINEVCEQALHEMAPLAKEYGQELLLSGSQCSHLVLANRAILHDIVVNLVDNAIVHNPSGGKVEVFAKCRTDQVRLHVHDNGQGIRVEELLRLRQTVGSQPQPLSGRAGTSGLGLYIVGQFAKSMGGMLGVGRPTTGTTFFVDFLRSQQLSLI